MQQTCPDCGSDDALTFIAEVGQQVCSSCATVSHDFQLYEPTGIHEVAYALGAPSNGRTTSANPPAPVGPSGRPFWSNDIEESRRLNQLSRKPEVDARVRGTLSTLGYPGLFEQVDFLFQRARNESWKKTPSANPGKQIAESDRQTLALSSVFVPARPVARRVRWGDDSLFLATACCYAVLRRERAHVDIEAVAGAAQLPFSKVKSAFKWLRLLVPDAIRNIKLANPDPYIHRIVAFFRFHLSHETSSALSAKLVKFLRPLRSPPPNASIPSSPAGPPHLVSNTSFDTVEATAFDLCTLWWSNRTSGTGVPPHLAAFAIVTLAIEAHIKAPAPILETFRYVHQALGFEPSASPGRPQLTTDDPVSKNSIEYYKELCAAVKLQASKIPWLSHMASVTRKSRSKLRTTPTSSDSDLVAMSDLARRDIIINALDIIEVWRTISPKGLDHQQRTEPNFRTTGANSAASHHVPLAVSEEDATQSSIAKSSEHDASEQEVDTDELDCFVSDAQLQSRLENHSEHTPSATISSEERVNQEVWPRIESRLQAAGALKRSTNHRDDSSIDHPIDLLTDDQVDRLLFDTNELTSLLRTDPGELAAFEKAKVAAGDWPARSEDQRDAEIAAYARRAAPDALPAKKLGTTPLTGSSRQSLKRRAQPADSGLSRSQQKSMAHQGKRPRASISKVSLQQQEEESDWSD